MSGLIMKTAVFSECGKFRYSLTREWDRELNQLCFVMLNPSIADDTKNDATIRRCIGFAKRVDCGGIVVVNLFALVSTFPAGLASAKDPVGPFNDEAILQAVSNRRVICAWGNGGNFSWLPKHRDRAAKVMALLDQTKTPAFCLGLTKFGHPSHPLRLPWKRKLQHFDLAKGGVA